MKSRNIFGLCLASLVVLMAVLIGTRTIGPVIGFPGGPLNGVVKQVPAGWPTAIQESTIQLETNPEDPYSVNLWGVIAGSHFYIATKPEGTAWSKNIDVDSRVRLGVGESIYALSAVRIDDESEISNVHEAYVKKYEVDPKEIILTAVLIYRLDSL